MIRDAIAQILNVPEVDCGIDAIGYEAHGHGHQVNEDSPTDALDTLIEVTRYGGRLGIVGVYFSLDPQGRGRHAKMGRPPFEWGRAWDKGLTFSTGQVPVMRYNRHLMTSILFDRVRLSHVLGTTLISLDEAPDAYAQFNAGVAKKFVLDPHRVLSRTETKAKILAETGHTSLGGSETWP